MRELKNREYRMFDLFEKQWALVTAGNMDHHNGCTVGWGSFGTLWARPGNDGSVVTIYIHPARYTLEFLQNSDTFTVSFFPETCRKALTYMGMHSGRDEDKDTGSGLTPVEVSGGVTYKEAELTFVCRKLLAQQFDKSAIDPEVQAYYASNPKVYPVNEEGEWEPHWMFIGEILDVVENPTK